MQLVDVGVAGQVAPLRGAALHDPQEAVADQRAQARLQDRCQEGLGRVHLQEHDPVGHEQLVDRIERRNRGDVARAQDQAHAAVIGLAIGDRLRQPQLLPGDARLHPDLAADARIGEPIEPIDRHHPGRDPAVGERRDTTRDARHAAPGDAAQRSAQHAQLAKRDVRPGHRLLRRFFGTEPLGLGDCRAPLIRHRRDIPPQLVDQLDARSRRDSQPGRTARTQLLHRGIERRADGGIEGGMGWKVSLADGRDDMRPGESCGRRRRGAPPAAASPLSACRTSSR